MDAITYILQIIPLIIIVVSVFFSVAIIRSKINYNWKGNTKVFYWCFPALCYLALILFSFMYAQYSDELENGVLGVFLIMSISFITPLFLYCGMIYLEYSITKNKHRIIWITPIVIIIIYTLFLLLPILSKGDFNNKDIISLARIIFVIVYFNSIILFPVLTAMIARVKVHTPINDR